MTRRRSVWVSVFGLMLAFASGCGDGGKHGAPVAGEAPAEADCGDGKDNDGDGFVDCDDLDCRATSKSCELAPALDRTVATTVWESAQFLFNGKDPIQKGTKAKQFSRKRIAILRGKVVDRAGKPLPGVQVSVAGHDEWGTTSTRPDGLFDLAVNGGSELLVQFSRDGYLAAERGVAPHWESYQAVPSVGLIEEGSSATKVAAHVDHEQVAVGEAVEDKLGSRQPLLVFVRDLTATATLDDGSEKDLPEFHVRLTEYPFEAPSREALNEPSRFAPGTTPTRGGVTYGIEASIDEARDLGASEVHFSDPISIVVENFLKLPVGSPVPLGYYERGKGHWQPEQGGRVIELLGVTGDEADIDADGDGEADDDSALEDAGVSHAERRELRCGKRAGRQQIDDQTRITAFCPRCDRTDGASTALHVVYYRQHRSGHRMILRLKGKARSTASLHTRSAASCSRTLTYASGMSECVSRWKRVFVGEPRHGRDPAPALPSGRCVDSRIRSLF